MYETTAFEPSWYNAATTATFVDPFADAASRAMPEGIRLALRWAEFIINNQGLYCQALKRVLSYFITPLEILGDIGDDERKEYADYLNDDLGISNILTEVGMDFLTYNNSITSVLARFLRKFGCPKCGAQFAFHRMLTNQKLFNYRWVAHGVSARCPGCDYQGDWGRPIDQPTDDVYVHRWNIHDVELKSDQDYSEDTAFIWKINPDYRRKISRGDPFVVERANWDVVQAVKQGKDFEFDKDNIFHMTSRPAAGIRSQGWGIPQPIVNFRNSWRLAIIERSNEAILQDHINPFRVLTPETSEGDGDPLHSFSMGSFVPRVQDMLQKRQRDPNAWFILPFGLKYQGLGADAKELAPADLLNQAVEILLNAVGVPVELFKGSLQIQTAPAAIRLFEANWTYLTTHLNFFLDFLSRRLSRLLSWKRVKLRLTKVTLLDDIGKVNARLQLGVGGQISQTSALQPLGLEPKEEIRRMQDEERDKAKIQQEFQEEQEGKGVAQQMGQPQQPGQSQGGQPVGQPGQDSGQQTTQAGQQGVQQALQSPLGDLGKMSPQDMMAVAQQEAGRLMSVPQAQRTSELIQLKQKSPTLHALVKAQLDQMRRQAQQIGGQQVLQQQFGGGQQQAT